MAKYAKNPRSPIPELVTAEVSDRLTVYGWKCDKAGILAYADSKADAIAQWHKAYQSEYFNA